MNLLVPVAVLWWGICLGQSAEAVSWWRHALDLWGAVDWWGLLTPGLAIAAGRHAVLLGLAAAGALAFAGLGSQPVALLRPRGLTARERHALGVLAGFAVPGLAWFGLSLCGLAFGALLAGGLAAALVLPGARALARSVAVRPAAPIGGGWWLIALGPLVPAALAMLVPDAHIDTLTYHLAIPEQVLRTHRFTSLGASLTTGVPLTTEFVYTIAIVLGREELSHWLQAAPFLAAVVLAAGWAARRGGAGAGWAAAIAILTCAGTIQQAAVAKNDLSAVGFALAGAVGVARALEGEGAWLWLSGLLFGLGGGVKWNVDVLAAVALACLLPVARLRRGAPAWVLLAALGVLPWLVRSWLWFGDPLWPALSGWWPGAWWRAEDAQSVLISRGVGGLPASAKALLGEAGGSLWREMPGVALALPFLLIGQRGLGRPERWLLGFAGLAMAACAVTMRSEWVRLAAPGFCILAVPAAIAATRVVGGWRPWLRRGAVAAAALSCWLPLGYFLGAWVLPVPAAPFLAGAITRGTWRAQRLTTLEGARIVIGSLRDRGRCMIAISDMRFHGLPVRMLSTRTWGCPWAWDLAKTAPSRARIRIRFRQLGVRYVLYNFLTEGYPQPIVTPYAWDDRMLAVWREFVERDLDLAVRPARLDNLNGCFCFWRLRDAPAPVPPAFLPYLPGVSSLSYAITSEREPVRRLEAALRVAARIPHVDLVDALTAEAYFSAGDGRRAWEYLQPSLRHRTLCDGNYWGAANLAARLGRFADAERYADWTVEGMPYMREAVGRWRRELHAFLAARRSPAPVPAGLLPRR
ncbi:MAG: hypothetical protein AAB152_10510 [Candidatus Coatesbacteria bacterium]